MKAPKIAQALASLVGIARKETDPARIEAALADARGQIEAAKTDRTAAETAYRDSLLDVSEAELQKRLAERNAATVRLDRAEALVAALTERLALARETEARAARQAIHDDAVTKVEAIRARLPAEYRHHALAIRSLLRDLAEAEVALDRAAREAHDFPIIPSPETGPRELGGFREEIVGTEAVELWTIDGRTDPIPTDQQGNVQRTGEHRDRGTISLRGNGHHTTPTSGVSLTCTLRTYTRTRYREAVTDPFRDLLIRTVTLPGFAFNDDAFVSANPLRDPDRALAELSVDLPPAGTVGRPIRERLELEPAVPRVEAEVVPLRGAA